jgi:D-beta-D-heptose 7-phosphate kinase/D-beta-D-heptose 1-phosphate adenosyltransferase
LRASQPLVVVGDTLLDRDVRGSVDRIAPDAPVPVLDERTVAARPGGAGLAAALAALDGREVTLVTALGDDPAGAELAETLRAAGVELIDVGLDGATPEKIRLMADGRPLLRLDRGGGGAPAAATAAARAAIGWAGAVLVADYGRGMASDPGVRAALEALPTRVPVVWDPHPRGPAPTAGVALVTPNHSEAKLFAADPQGEGDADALRALDLRERWRAHGVCVTRGAKGAVLADDMEAGPVLVPAPRAGGGDACGAGDRFAVRAAEVLADGGDVRAAVLEAVVAASAFVAGGGAGAALARATTPAAAGDGCPSVVPAVRAAGGTVVATGGCFDLLHVGHIRTLQAARALGDCLVVCLNSDASVRRLKGTSRPLVPEAERAAVLKALECVDDVVIFGEDTPADALTRLRPDVWAKGGDYAVADLPESSVLAGWGGRVAILPYLDGRSTTALIEEANLHAAS